MPKLDKCMLYDCPSIKQLDSRNAADCGFWSTSAGEHFCSLRATVHTLEMRKLDHPNYIIKEDTTT